MKRSVVKIFFVAAIIGFVSCGKSKKMTIKVQTENIELAAMDSIPVSIGTDVSFLALQEPQNTFAEINGIQVYNDTIYIFDKNTRNTLVSFSKSGKYLATFSQRGNAKNEYSRLWAFDVDRQYVYMYDRANMKMMLFTHDGKFVKTEKTKFRGDSFKVLANGNYLFSMALSENLNKLCLVDNKFNIINVLLTFDSKDKDNLANDNLFQRAGDEIIYNKELNDTIYAFNDEGACKRAYSMNFAGVNVSQEYKHDFERLWEDGKDKAYAYMDDCPMVSGTIVVTPLSYKGRHGVVYYDLQEKTVIKGFKAEVPNPLCVWNGKLIGWMELDTYKRCAQKDNVPDNVVKRLNSGGRVLVLGNM